MSYASEEQWQPKIDEELGLEYEEKASPLAAMLVCVIYGFCIGLIIGIIIGKLL